MRDAKAELEKYSGSEALSAVDQLHLGRRYGFDDWIRSATPKIVHTPLSSLSPQDYELLGAQTLYHLVQFNLRLIAHRQRLAVALPTRLTSHSSQCGKHHWQRCSHAWRTVCDQFTTSLFQTFPITEWDICRMLQTKQQEASKLADMVPECANTVVQSVEKGLKGRDEDLILETIKTICSS